MKHSDLKAALTALMLATATASMAVPANRTPRCVSLPDGSTLTLTLIGDEHHHAYFTTDRCAVLPAEDGFYYYATLDAEGRAVRSAVRAHDEGMRSAEELAYADALAHDAIARALDADRAGNVARRMAGGDYTRTTPRQAALRAAQQGADGPRRTLDSTYPTTGAQKGLVILVQYTDVTFHESDEEVYAYFDGMLNEKDFDGHRARGSVRDYFLESSMGKFSPTFDVYGPLTLAHNQAYYGANDWYGNDQHPEQMVIEACQMLDDSVDFSQYDRDNDGEIDNVYIFYAGLGEASGGSANTVWPHSWDVRHAGGGYIYLDGCLLGHYACSNELEPSGYGTQDYDGMGTFAHEFSHVLGLSDHYATSYTSAFTPGSWDLLDAGSYNGDSRCPPYYTAYERYEMGWMTPTQIPAQPGTYSLKPIYENQAYLIPTEKNDEYFLLENRQQTRWDEEIPGHGMLVWHVDYNPSIWAQNTINNNANHQYLDIEEADNTRTEYTRAGDAFPGTANVTSFTDDTNPNMKSWSGHRQERPITNIREQNGIITFDVLGGRPLLPTVAVDSVTDIRPDGFTLHWTPNDSATNYVVSVYTVTTADNGRLITHYADGYRDLKTGDVDCLVVNGLTPATDYTVSLAAADDYFTGDATTAEVRTADPTFEFLAPELLDASDIQPDGFTAHWTELDGATGYEITIYTKTLGEPDKVLEQHFDNNLNLGAMWHTNVTATYAQAAYAGIAPPSLRFLADGDHIETNPVSGDIQHAQFWHLATSEQGQNAILVQVRVGNQWQTIDRLTSTQDASADHEARYGRGEAIAIPEGARYFRLSYDRVNAGRVAIDDIVLAYGGPLEADSIPELTEVSVLATEYTASSLDAERTYYYKVRARSGELCSLWSAEGIVTTAGAATAIEEVAAQRPAPQAGQIYDLQGRRLLGAPRSGAYIMDGRLRFTR